MSAAHERVDSLGDLEEGERVRVECSPKRDHPDTIEGAIDALNPAMEPGDRDISHAILVADSGRYRLGFGGAVDAFDPETDEWKWAGYFARIFRERGDSQKKAKPAGDSGRDSR